MSEVSEKLKILGAELDEAERIMECIHLRRIALP